MATKPHYQHIEDFLTAKLPIWQDRMGLSHWDIGLAFLDSFDGEQGFDDFHVTAVCETRWNYLQCKIKFYLPSAIRHTDEHLEQVLVHELCHTLLSPEQAIMDDHLDEQIAIDELSMVEADLLTKLYYERLELATEMTARAIWRAWERHGE